MNAFMPNFEKSPQVEPGEQQESKSNEPVFNPGEELKKVRETPKAQRLEQLATYKKNLAEQMAGMAKINEELESLVLNKSVSREELGIYLKERAQTYKLSPPQLEKYDLVLDKIEQQKKVIDFIDGRLAGRSEKEIFWIMFGFKPKGEVEIKKDAISFFVKCVDLRDYARCRNGSDDQESLSRVKTSAGFARQKRLKVSDPGIDLVLDYGITVLNGSLRRTSHYKEYAEEVRIHEEKHILNDIMREAENEVKNNKTIGSPFAQILNREKIDSERRAKDEILAYLKDGTDAWFIYNTLLEKKSDGGSYDYLASAKQAMESVANLNPEAKSGRALLENAYKKMQNEYRLEILTALEQVINLDQLGFSKTRIIGLLEAEPLARWPKVYQRFRKSQEFVRAKEKAKKDSIEMVAYFKRTLEDAQVQLEKEGTVKAVVNKAKEDYAYAIGHQNTVEKL